MQISIVVFSYEYIKKLLTGKLNLHTIKTNHHVKMSVKCIPLKPHFYIEKLGLQPCRGIHNFLIFYPKTMWVLVRIWSRFAYSHFAYSRFAYSRFAYSGHSMNSRFAYSALFVSKHIFFLFQSYYNLFLFYIFYSENM